MSWFSKIWSLITGKDDKPALDTRTTQEPSSTQFVPQPLPQTPVTPAAQPTTPAPDLRRNSTFGNYPNTDPFGAAPHPVDPTVGVHRSPYVGWQNSITGNMAGWKHFHFSNPNALQAEFNRLMDKYGPGAAYRWIFGTSDAHGAGYRYLEEVWDTLNMNDADKLNWHRFVNYWGNQGYEMGALDKEFAHQYKAYLADKMRGV